MPELAQSAITRIVGGIVSFFGSLESHILILLRKIQKP
jgi:hypothetical protein